MRVAIVAPLVSADPRATAWRVTGVRLRSRARPGGQRPRGPPLRRLRIAGAGRAGDRHRGRSPRACRHALPRLWSGRSSGLVAAEAAFAAVYAAVREARYDVVHNHAFDAPAISLATRLRAPVVHTLHLPPDAAVADALRDAARSDRAPAVAGVSACQASAWRHVVSVDAILPPFVPTRSIRWSPSAGDGAVFAGRLSPEKGAVEAIEIAQAAGVRIDVYGDSYDAEYTPGADRPATRRSGRRCPPRRSANRRSGR